MDNSLQTVTIPDTTIILSGRGIAENQLPSIHLTVKATVEIDERSAQRCVTIWLASEVGNMLVSGTPQLIIDPQGKHQTIWRVSVHLTSSKSGMLDQVGTVDVDGISGELLNIQTAKATILNNVNDVIHPA